MFNAIKNITLGIGYGLYLTALAPKSQRDAALQRARTPRLHPAPETVPTAEGTIAPTTEEVIAPEAVTEQPETQVEVEAPQPEPEQPKVEIDLAALDSTTLRKLCAQYGIPWRNVRGQGRHLTKGAMVFQLQQITV